MKTVFFIALLFCSAVYGQTFDSSGTTYIVRSDANLRQWKITNATTNATDDLLTLIHNSSGTPAANFGAGIAFGLGTTTTDSRFAGRIKIYLSDATDATRTSQFVLSLVNSTANTDVLTITGAGNATFLGTVGATNLSGTSSGTNTGDVTLAGENYLSLASQVVTANAVTLSGTNVTGTLPMGKGGTAVTTLALNGVLYGNAATSILALAVNSTATNKFLTQSSSNAPAWATLVSGDIPNNGANTTGSAATLTTSRNINSVAFNGSADITVTADANTLTNTTLKSTVVNSSLTSVGTLTSLIVGSASGLINSNAGTLTFNTSAAGAIPYATSTTAYTANSGDLTYTTSAGVLDRISDAATNTVVDVATITHNSSGVIAANFGTGILLNGQSTTTADRNIAEIQGIWSTATDATRVGDLVFKAANNTALRTVFDIAGSGNVTFWGKTTSSSSTAGLVNFDLITSGTPAAGFGLGRNVTMQDATTTGITALQEKITWTDAAHATATSKYTIQLNNATIVGDALILTPTALNIPTGSTYQINSTNVLTNNTLGSGVTASSLTSFGASPTFVTPILGTPTSGNLTNCTWGSASGLINSNAGTITFNTAAAGSIPFSTSTTALTANSTNLTYTATAGVLDRISDAATNTSVDLLTLTHNSSGVIAASFGTGLLFNGQSSTTADRNIADISAIWTTATDASRVGNLVFQVANNTALATAATIKPTAFNIPTGSTYQINGTDVLSNNTLGTGVLTSSLTTIGTCTAGSVPGAFIGTQVILNGTTTYTPTSGTKTVTVVLVGAGGGGGGVKGAASSSGAAGGGGSGGVCVKTFGSVSGTYTVAVGALGGGGSGVTPSNGTGGGNTTFANGGTTYTAFGGSGGVAMTSLTTLQIKAGGAGGVVSTNGDVNGGGAPGEFGVTVTAALCNSGSGGSSPYGGGGVGLNSSSATGTAGTGFGSGGAGAACIANSNQTGGAGTNGVLIIYEYK